MFKLDRVSKKFIQGQTEINVLSGLSFELAQGETVSIVGQSGSGKSTLLSILSGLQSVDEGHLFFDGEDLTNLSQERLTSFRATKLGIIFQHFHLIPHLTALENISLPLEILKIEDEDRAHELLDRVGLSNRANHLPSQMSGGEMQRVAVARALIARPKVILADEPSGNLDKDNANKVIELMFNLVQEERTSLILVTHDNSLASMCERTLHLSDGRLH